ncbi:ferredoxin [Pseudonocardia endophytica]|uniref:Ferredoxin n=1 Tax=Pseudonocardia endophytica TaxID=401976 RepID=A0A4R1HYT5_PSEEN|nr:ferredoxin [Pseudonocardia endophytica]TCK26711.1 4Fe-4S binding protein [Pseudonocardia endophytica]
MTYFISSECIDVKDRACVEECPVDCIYEGDRKMYINPVECIDCGACEMACPMDAIRNSSTVGRSDVFAVDNADYFREPLPGRAEPLGNPGGAMKIGTIAVDTPFVSTYGS